MSKKVIAVVGKSCSGKDTVLHDLKDRIKHDKGVTLVDCVTHTTRPKRESETNGVEHWFVSESEFYKLEDIEAYTSIDGFMYATTYSSLKNSDIVILDPNEYIKKKTEWKQKYDIDLLCIYVEASYDVRAERAINRAVNESEFIKYCSRVVYEASGLMNFPEYLSDSLLFTGDDTIRIDTSEEQKRTSNLDLVYEFVVNKLDL